MTTRSLLTACLLAMTAALPVAAQVQASDAWARATVAQQKATGAFVTLQSKTVAALVSASSPVAEQVELHEMRMEGSTMRMRQVEQIALPAGQSVTLRPGGLHLMLFGLKQTLTEGSDLPLVLQVRHVDGKVESLAVTAKVRALGASAPMGHAH
ncbi:copper chaperone PCu(A)C [Inhella gelatinilytica]|uniref:Copper chaperone PCu(A)C n=1 Tax=Inhella gelatinilytica TaxID=2795030 RepID=A0A931IXD1_9BURK|nr:copper chaperone PCu(A)C [Inhella gelatinilytica]MBH9552809.1 copper chaperone PCu(A)C [Inhella gelatinilytica]